MREIWRRAYNLLYPSWIDGFNWRHKTGINMLIKTLSSCASGEMCLNMVRYSQFVVNLPLNLANRYPNPVGRFATYLGPRGRFAYKSEPLFI
jgi:hypothetical protein